MTKRTKYILGAMILLAATALVALFSGGDEPQTPEEPRYVSVSVSRPVVDTVFEPVRYVGTLEGSDDAALGFRTSGTVASILVREGERIAAGARLATLDQPESAARVQRARAELSRAEANLHHWQRELEIDERLLEQGAVPRTRRDQTALSLENAARARESAAAGLREAEAMAEMSILRAPSAGVIASVERTPGEAVMAGQPVIQLTAGHKRIRADVLEKDVLRGIAQGTSAMVTAGGCGAVRGRVVSVEPSVRPPLRSMRVYIDADPACLAGLASGAELPVTFHVRQDSGALLLPASAIDIRGGSARVFRLGDHNIVEAIPVELGVQRDSLQQVIGAISAEDQIVTSGRTNIRSGDRVRVRSTIIQTGGTR